MLALPLAAPSVAHGQSDSRSSGGKPRIEIERLVVTATRHEAAMAGVPASISVIGVEDIQDARPTVSLSESLNRVPGVFVQDSGNFAQDVRIQIRGFGTRAAFGIREIRVLVDGLPETFADGQTQLDAVDLGSIGRIEVLRDTASSLYGNAAGGVIQLFTEDGPEAPWAATRLTAGSFGLRKLQLKGGGRSGGTHVYVNGSHLHLSGYRDQSESVATLGTVKVRRDLGAHTAVTVLFNAVDAPVAEDPGGLTRQQTRDDPAQAQAANVRFDAGEMVRQARIGLVLHHRGAPHDLSGHAYLLHRDFENRLAFENQGVVGFERFSPGAGLHYSYDAPVAGVSQRLSVGLDAQHLDDDRSRHDNLEGRRGSLRVRQTERVTSVGPYLLEAVRITEDVEVSAGVRHDRVRFDVEVDFDNTGASAGGGARTLSQWSPGGGLRWTPRRDLTLFGKLGTSFQVPTTTELANPRGGGLNPAVGPQSAVGYETGARFKRRRIEAGVAAFLIDVDDELIPFEDPVSGRTAFRNAGRSRRRGLEVDWSAEIYGGVRWRGAATWIDAEFRQYEVDGQDLGGNREPGIPPWFVFQQIVCRHRSGAFAALEAFLVDGYHVDDANRTRTRAYELVSLRIGMQRRRGRWTFEPFVGFDNLLDQEYDGTVRLNAAAGRYFEPAPGFNVFGGLSVSALL